MGAPLETETRQHLHCPIDAKLIEYRVGAVEKAVEQISVAVKIIAESTSQIVSLEQRHAETREGLERAFKAVSVSDSKREKLSDRIQELELNKADDSDVRSLSGRVATIETALPSLKESSSWIRAGMLSLVGLVLFAAIKLSLNL